MASNDRKFFLVSDFKGYHAREDITNLPPGYMVRGSRDVLTNSANRIGVRKGYTLKGVANPALTPIESSYDWNTHLGTERNLRSYGNKLQFWYLDAWRDVATGFSNVAFNYAEFWDTTEMEDVLLFVNGTSNIYEWNGAATTLASVTGTTITKEGTTSWAEEGFYTAGTRRIIIDGIVYTYTGGENTTTLTGVTPNPTAGSHVVGSVIIQEIRITANSSMTDIPATFKNDLISFLYNQIYIGSLTSREVYVSKVNDYKDYSFSTPRAVGDGALITLDGCPTTLIPQEDQMYMSAGKDQWYRTQFQLSSDLMSESLTIQRLKTNSKTAARSQGYTSKDDNKVFYLNFEPTIDTLGRVDSIFAIPDITNMSDEIRDDMNTYDFSSNLGDIVFFKNFWYISVPLNGLVLVYNVAKQYWEVPQNLPIGKFSIIDGELYGHSAAVAETYKLFDGTSDNGHPILAILNFSYQNFENRANLKSFNEYYVEGYIASNTTLTFGVRYEIDGCGTGTEQSITGVDKQVVCIPTGDDNSLGKHSLGKYPLGSALSGPSQLALPPKFRVKKTFPRYDFFEVQFSFSSYGPDQVWEILAFGPEVTLSKNDSGYVKQ